MKRLLVFAVLPLFVFAAGPAGSSQNTSDTDVYVTERISGTSGAGWLAERNERDKGPHDKADRPKRDKKDMRDHKERGMERGMQGDKPRPKGPKDGGKHAPPPNRLGPPQ